MNFLDAAFLLAFLPGSLILFSLARRVAGSDGSRAALVAGSLLFCAPFGWGFTALVTINATVNFWLCRAMVQSPVRRSALLIAGLVVNFGTLIVFKYGLVFAWIPGAAPLIKSLAWITPITISFLIFQRLVLLLDCYQRQEDAVALLGGGELGLDERRGGALAFGVFVMSFPNLVIGPIAYGSEVRTRLLSNAFGKLRRADLETGMTLVVIGLIKKTMIADPLGYQIVDTVFAKVHAGHSVLAVEAAVAMLGYYAQLYFDFSGYSDIAIGIGRMFGLRFPMNFNSPLRATGIADFYRRWHITLTRVVARFMFTQLSIKGTRFASRRGWRGWRAQLTGVWLPLLINFEVIGIWHGARLTFVCFGLMHGLWFILETEARRAKWWKRFRKQTTDATRMRLGQLISILPLVTSFALFRSRTLGDFGALLGNFSHNWLAFFDRGQSHFILPQFYPIFGVAFAIVWLLPNAYELMRRYRPGIVTFPVPSYTPVALRFVWRPTLFWGVIVAIGMLFVVRALGTPAPFVYGDF